VDPSDSCPGAPCTTRRSLAISSIFLDDTTERIAKGWYTLGMTHDLETLGFSVRPAVVPETFLAALLATCTSSSLPHHHVRHPAGGTYGIRGLLWSSSSLRSDLQASGVSDLACEALGEIARPIDAIFFDKSLDTNWAVPGHQDRLMPVDPSCTVATTTRGDVAYAEPSVATLAGLVAIRVHFDSIGRDGALEVVPGSHRLGLMSSAALRAVSLNEYQACIAERGDVLVMKPLLLHRSSRRIGGGHRRVLHVVYAGKTSPSEVAWRT
jgi:hypothetical protein